MDEHRITSTGEDRITSDGHIRIVPGAVAEATWPATLPAIPMLPVTIGFEDGVILTSEEPVRARRVTTANAEPFQFRLVLTYAQLTVFRGFWNAQHGRALPFSYYWPETKSSRDMRFIEPPEFQAYGRDLWEVTLACEILPHAT